MAKKSRSSGKNTTLTKNQKLKADRSNKQAERLRQVLSYEVKKEVGQGPVVNRIRRCNMLKYTIKRRLGVISRLEGQLKKEVLCKVGEETLTQEDITRINKELTTLKSRI